MNDIKSCIVDNDARSRALLESVMLRAGNPLAFVGGAHDFLTFSSKNTTPYLMFLNAEQLDIPVVNFFSLLIDAELEVTFICISCICSVRPQIKDGIGSAPSLVLPPLGSCCMAKGTPTAKTIEHDGFNSKIETVLTPKELRILELVGTGLSTKKIASTEGLSTNTINNHRKSIISKLGYSSAAELITTASIHSYFKNQKRSQHE